MENNAYSVVIPAYNAEKHIAETVQSVLAQSVLPAQIIVVDDGSTDATAQIAAGISPLVWVISTANKGAGAATSTGIAAVTTAIVATLDSDDVWHPRKMEIQLAVLLDSSLGLDAVLAKLRPFGDTHIRTAPEETSGWARSSLVIWRAAFHRVGDVRDMGNGYGEMIDWFARARAAGLKFKLLDQTLADRRIHPDSYSFRAGAGMAGGGQARDFLRVAMLALERKRQR